MAYQKQTWVNGSTGGTPINADRLNHMEDGIYNAYNYGTLLWTNSSPTSAFSGQTITLSDSISNYDFYEVIYSEYAGNEPYGSSGRIPTSQITNIGQVANLFVRRSVTALSGTSMTFGDGQQCASFNGSWTSQNSRIVPVYVIGYKTEMFD